MELLKTKNSWIFLCVAVFFAACSGEKRGEGTSKSHTSTRTHRSSSKYAKTNKPDYRYKVMMRKKGGVYQVKAKINGTPLDFILDTGCSDVSISLTEAEYFLKNKILTKDDLGDIQYGRLANGGFVKTLDFNIKTMEFGGKKLYNVRASIIDNASAPLLLGQSVLSKLRSLNIDNGRREVKFN